jgi:hypothetical protein
VADVDGFFGRKPKRIVTGQREDGSSYFVSVEEVDEDFRAIGSHRMWATDHLPVQLPFLGQEVPLEDPAPIGELQESLRNSNAKPQMPESLRVHLHYMKPGSMGRSSDAPFMHWHDTFDVQWLMAGELTITLDGDEREVTMKPGDAVIQHGTNHAWRVGPEGCVLAIFMIGAERTGIAPPEQNYQPV